MSADIPHGLPGARSVARAFPCKRCTPRKVSSLFPWVSSCSTRWNQASPAPPPSPAGFTLVSAAYFSPLWQNCLARVNGRACAWNACEAWQESVCEWIYVCVGVCLACAPWVTIRTVRRAKKKNQQLQGNGNLSKKRANLVLVMMHFSRVFVDVSILYAYSGLYRRDGLFEIARNGMKVITCFNIHCRP